MFNRMLFVGLNTNDLNIIKKLIRDYQIGGVILYKKNYNTYQEMLNLINFIKKESEKAGYTILIGIDQEGYRVNRLPKEFHNLKSPYSFKENPDNFTIYGKITGEILHKSGISINFAPVLDLNKNKSIGDRSFGDNIKEICLNSKNYINALKKENVAPTIKHFPGHGSSKLNSHKLFPIILNSKNIFENDIIPFKKAIKEDIPLIMLGHLIIPKFSGLLPTSLSKKTIKYLRNDLKYSNIIITDDLNMGLFKFFNKSMLIKKAINSGADLIMIKYTPSFFKDYAKLSKAYNKGKLNKDNINQSNNRINTIIKQYNFNNKVVQNTLNIEKINKEIDTLNKKEDNLIISSSKH